MPKHRRIRIIAGLTLTFMAAFSATVTAEPVSDRFERVFGELQASATSCPDDLDAFGVSAEARCVTVTERFKQVRRAFRREFDQAMSFLDSWSRESKYRTRVVMGITELFSVAFHTETGILAVVPNRPCPIDSSVRSAEEDGYAPPRVVKRVHPEHPALARQAGQNGTVILRLLVREDGGVGDVCTMIVEPPGYGFEQAAVQASSQWRFEPATIDGAPVANYVLEYVAWTIGGP